LASSFVIWLVGAVGTVLAFRKARWHLRQSRYLIAVLCVAVGMGFVWFTQSLTTSRKVLADDPIPNNPIGVARGLHPGRVVWIYDPNATVWAGPGSGDGYWWESNHTNQYCVDNMMSQAIKNLAGETTDSKAWNAIFRNFNVKHSRGNIAYTVGERIAIKVNLSTCNQRLRSIDTDTYDKTNYLDRVDTSPQMIVALLRQLVYGVGVEQSDIAVGDPVAYFPNNYWNICHSEFPDVKYLDPEGKFGRTKVEYSIPLPIVKTKNWGF